jgi:hypothetical protein
MTDSDTRYGRVGQHLTPSPSLALRYALSNVGLHDVNIAGDVANGDEVIRVNQWPSPKAERLPL